MGSGCKEADPEILEPIHFPIETLTDELPFESFNNFNKAIFRNDNGQELTYNISILEEVVTSQFHDIKYSYNKTNFSYDIDFSFQVPSLSISTSLKYLNETEKNELILCGSRILSTTAASEHLIIKPGDDFHNTKLHEEFEWMGTTFSNVYSNNLIDQTTFRGVRLFFKPSIGIIGFTGFTGNEWIFDRYE